SGALERDEIDRLFDDADDRAVASPVEADGADLLLGEVAALVAEADAFLHLADRFPERVRLGRRHLQQVEGEPLRRPAPDARQARQLRNEILNRRGEHDSSVTAGTGRLKRRTDAEKNAAG